MYHPVVGTALFFRPYHFRQQEGDELCKWTEAKRYVPLYGTVTAMNLNMLNINLVFIPSAKSKVFIIDY